MSNSTPSLLIPYIPELDSQSSDEIIRTLDEHGTRPFEELEGMFSWNLLVAIPLDIMGVKFTGEPITMMANFYKCADLTSTPHFLSWAPIDTPEPDFHRPEFFAPITLEGK